MLELKFRNVVSSLCVLLAGIIAAFGSGYLTIAQVSLPVPIIITGLIAVYLVLNTIAFPKASVSHLVQLTIAGFFLGTAGMIASITALNYFNQASVSIDFDFVILASPLIIGTNTIFGFFALINMAVIEETTSSPVDIKSQTPKQETETPVVLQQETISYDLNIVETVETNEYISVKNQFTDEIATENKVTNEVAECLELYPKVNTKNVEKPEIKEEFFELGELPHIKLDENAKLNSDFEVETEKISETTSETNENEYFDFIPTDIRLVEAPISKENDQKGKIASIGKMLVNNRDLEGVIEFASEGETEGKTNIVSSSSGEQFYEKFSRLKKQYTHIREIALVDKGGFIIAGDFEDERSMHIAGALVAGIYHTLQNYLAQISFKNPEKIFFETENSNSFIIKTDDKFIFSNWDKEFKHLENDLPDKIAEIDMTPFIDLGQIECFANYDEAGQLKGNSVNISGADKLSIISSALFENIKVFLMNIKLCKLSKLTVFSDEKVLTVEKLDNEMVAIVTPISGLVKISNEFLKTDLEMADFQK